VSRAADALRLRRTTLIEKMKKFGIMRCSAA
jgi:Bacterial regulatory protein, Fis family.